MSSDPRRMMLAAIGGVVVSSGEVAMQLQQLAEAVTGTGLVYFMLQDATLGTQVGQVMKIIDRATSNEWIEHPEIDEEVRFKTLSALKLVEKPLVEFRNRIVHNVWMPMPNEDNEDGILGHRATRWGKESIETTLRSLHLLEGIFGITGALLSAAERSISGLRNHGRAHLSTRLDDPLQELERLHPIFVERATEMRNGTHSNWVWKRVQMG